MRRQTSDPAVSRPPKSSVTTAAHEHSGLTGTPAAERNSQDGGRGERRGEPGRLLSRHQRYPGAEVQREPRVRVPEGRHEEPGDAGGSREALYI